VCQTPGASPSRQGRPGQRYRTPPSHHVPHLPLPPCLRHIEVTDWHWPSGSMDKLRPNIAAAPTSLVSKAAVTPTQLPFASLDALARHWPRAPGPSDAPAHGLHLSPLCHAVGPRCGSPIAPLRQGASRQLLAQTGTRYPNQPLTLTQYPNISPTARSAIGTHRGTLSALVCLAPPDHPFYPQSMHLYKGQR
jgi:hypothetical protein